MTDKKTLHMPRAESQQEDNIIREYTAILRDLRPHMEHMCNNGTPGSKLIMKRFCTMATQMVVLEAASDTRLNIHTREEIFKQLHGISTESERQHVVALYGIMKGGN